jgi:hypothetical protein
VVDPKDFEALANSKRLLGRKTINDFAGDVQ